TACNRPGGSAGEPPGGPRRRGGGDQRGSRVMGIPVVVAANGYGMPVRAVSSGAPVMEVSEQGIPIVLSPRGAPFVITGLVPESPFQDFTVDAGSGNGGDTGYYTTIYGGISAEPLAGYVLEE